MRLGLALVLTSLVLAACAETPRCIERGTPPRTTIEIQCNAGKVAVCSNTSERLYQGADDPSPGALRPVPAESDADGVCDPGVNNCRTRPLCGGAGQAVTCGDGTSPICVRGEVTEITAPPPPVDSGPPEEDAGSDAGSDVDAGDVDAGDFDAGDFDAG
jgi:hypothetical protein